LEIRAEIDSRQQEADQLRCRAVEKAQVEVDLAQRRFMLVDPNNRLVADTLEAQWNDKLRALNQAREERELAKRNEQQVLNQTIRGRLLAMTTDFRRLWADPVTPNRERKRMLDLLIEDATLVKDPAQGITHIHIRFKGGKTETLTTTNPKSSAQQVKTRPEVIALVDKLLNDYTYAQIAERLNEQGIRPGAHVRPNSTTLVFTALRVGYLVTHYHLRSRYDRLRERGLLTKSEAAQQLGIHEATVSRWVAHGLVTRHPCSGNSYLYELPLAPLPTKHCSRWDRLAERAKILELSMKSKVSSTTEGGAV